MKRKECHKCGRDYWLYEYDGKIYCRVCLLDELHITEATVYYNDNRYFDDFDKILDYYDIKEIEQC